MTMIDTQRSVTRRRISRLVPFVLAVAIGCSGVNGQGTIGIGSASNTTSLPISVGVSTVAPSPGTTVAPSPGTVVTSPPTSPPVVTPTDYPTARPTTLPPTTNMPTSNPTSRPTTIAPTSSPTLPPTVAPTSMPTLPPTVRPTSRPTLAPTSRPTTSPTISPAPTTLTKRPTISPAPTPFPTRSPTDAPVLPPSLPPTMGTLQDVVDVVVRLNVMPSTLDDAAIRVLEQVTRDYLLFATSRLSPAQDIRAIDVRVFGQDLVSRRRLQTTTTTTGAAAASWQTLRIGFDVNIAHRAQDSDPTDWISQAFDTQAEQDVYISRLKAGSATTFQSVDSIGLRVDGRIVGVAAVEAPPTKPPSGDRPRTFWIIVIAAGGGGTALLLGLILILSLTHRRSRKGVKTSSKPSKASTARKPHAVSVDPSQMELAAEIHLQQRQDDISTLGDPMGGMHLGAGAPRDERTASVGHDYDYAKHFLSGAGRQNSMDSQNYSQPSKMSTALGPMDHTLQDEESLDQRYAGVPPQEERLEFEVPAGKLGMVIDTPDGHSPLVHAIKPGSVLDGKVRVGDFLVQVNHQDVTDWTAVKVSKYISALSGRARLLVFHRTPRRRAESSVFFEDGSV